MTFILNRTNDRNTRSKKWIVGYGLLFWLVSRIIAAALLVGVVSIYKSFGLDPESMTRFAGSPTRLLDSQRFIYEIITVILAAPIFEEAIFRLGLSFKRWQIGIAGAAIPLYLFWQHIPRLSFMTGAVYIFGAILVFCLIYFIISPSFWMEHKKECFRTVVWLSAIAFGLIHFVAFSTYSLVLVPYMFCVILIPFFAGCAITYYRINLGFWWGVGLHIFNNLPALGILLMQ